MVSGFLGSGRTPLVGTYARSSPHVLPSLPQIQSSQSCQARVELQVHRKIPGPWLCPWLRCTGLIRNTCVHGISCPGSAFISAASKTPRQAKVKETSQSITQTTATRAAGKGLSKLKFNSHLMAQPGQPCFQPCSQWSQPGSSPPRPCWKQPHRLFGLGHQAVGKAPQNDALSCQLCPAAVRAVA